MTDDVALLLARIADALRVVAYRSQRLAVTSRQQMIDGAAAQGAAERALAELEALRAEIRGAR